jgi:uncharacterized protein
MNVVIDTNVIISGLLNPAGVPAKIINLILNEELTLLYDNRILSEYKNVLNRKKFKFEREIIDALLDYIKNEGLFIVANPISKHFTDESDKMFLEVALSGNAEYLITGNSAHFPKDKFILTPREFIEKLSDRF